MLNEQARPPQRQVQTKEPVRLPERGRERAREPPRPQVHMRVVRNRYCLNVPSAGRGCCESFRGAGCNHDGDC